MKREKNRFRTLLSVLTACAVSLALLLSACGSTSNAQDLEAVVQAVDGRQVVLTLDDGSKIRVEAETHADAAKDMIGAEVKAKVEVGDDNPKLIDIEKTAPKSTNLAPGLNAAPEDFHFVGPIETMAADVWTIGGKTFKVNAATTIDMGLAVGIVAEVEFIVLSDGTMLAIKIETHAGDDIGVGDEPVAEAGEDFSLTGVIGSISASEVVVSGKAFKIDANTMLDQGLDAGVMARVEFVVQADGSFLALEVETDAPDTVLPGTAIELQEDFTANGPIQSLESGFVMVDGRKFIIGNNTILDSGLTPGVLVKVEFVMAPDGTLLAKEVETDSVDEGVNLYFAGPIQSMSPTAWVIGGKTFAVSPATLLDEGLGPGVNANVEFIIRADGSLLAVHIENTGFKFIGLVQAIGPDAYTIGGRIFKINANTLIDRGLKVRKLAQVEFLIQPDGSLLALQIKTPKTKVQGFTFKGVVQSLGANSIMVTGQAFQIGPTTIIGAGVAVGVEVSVTFDIKPGNILAAISVQNAKAVQQK